MKQKFRVLCAVLFLAILLQACAKNSDSSSGAGNSPPVDTTSKPTIGTVSTLAGSDSIGFADGPVAVARFNHPWGVAVDNQGDVFVADHDNNRIRKISAAGVVTTMAGDGTAGFADGNGTVAKFGPPNVIAADAQGNVYVADQANNRIRKITSQGVVTTLAGNGVQGLVNGPVASAEFYQPSGVAVDAQGNVYVADQLNNVIRKISSAGTVTTLAGNVQGFSNGTGSNAAFNGPNGIAVDAQGNVYVAETGNNDIRAITPAGEVTTVAGNGVGGYTDGGGLSAEFAGPIGLTIDAQGNLYVGDANNNRIRKITPAGVVTTIAGNGTKGFAEGTGTNAAFNLPWGVAVDAQGYLYVGDAGNNRIRKILLP